MNLAPIVLFTYNRLYHTKKTIEALKNNLLASDSKLIIYSDAPKNENVINEVTAVRLYIKQIDGFKEIEIIERTENLGLFKSIISGVTEVINKYDKVIVLEDDLITSKYFLKYMNDALTYYEKDKKVASITGYSLNIDYTNLPETYFLHFGESYGWGTWKNNWNEFEFDAQKLLDEIKSRGLESKFEFDGNYEYMKILEVQNNNKAYSWAILWCAKIFIDNKLTLYPSRSLVKSIGSDGSGTNCAKCLIEEDLFYTRLFNEPINVGNIEIKENSLAYFLNVNHYKKYKRNVDNETVENKIDINIERLFRNLFRNLFKNLFKNRV